MCEYTYIKMQICNKQSVFLKNLKLSVRSSSPVKYRISISVLSSSRSNCSLISPSNFRFIRFSVMESFSEEESKVIVEDDRETPTGIPRAESPEVAPQEAEPEEIPRPAPAQQESLVDLTKKATMATASKTDVALHALGASTKAYESRKENAGGSRTLQVNERELFFLLFFCFILDMFPLIVRFVAYFLFAFAVCCSYLVLFVCSIVLHI